MRHRQRLIPAGPVAAALVVLALSASVALASGPVHGPAARPSTIVLFRSIGVVSLGDSPRRVQRRLGPPTHLITLSHRVVQMEYGRFGLEIHFDPNRPGDPVNFVSTSAARFRTAKGIHAGSTTAALRHAYQRLRGAAPTYSLFGRRRLARTDFNIAGSTVQTIDIQSLRRP